MMNERRHRTTIKKRQKTFLFILLKRSIPNIFILLERSVPNIQELLLSILKLTAKKCFFSHFDCNEMSNYHLEEAKIDETSEKIDLGVVFSHNLSSKRKVELVSQKKQLTLHI